MSFHKTSPPELALPQPEEGTALYVHLPFCATKCHYCDFFSVPAEGQDLGGMVDAILVEAAGRAPKKPKTLFLGGGTPSLLPAKLLKRLLDGLQEITGWRDSVIEATAECNPESLDRDKARALLDLGIPRLSVGVQALDDEVLELFGRVHKGPDGLRALEAAREAGVEHLSADLIYAWPGQTLERWEHDLGEVLALTTQHISAYNLTYEEETRFKQWLDQGRLAKAPEELELTLFERARELCGEAGLGAYEVSNYSLKGHECLHNINYWKNGTYLGLGPGAVSKVGSVRAGNPRGIAPYLRWIESSGHATQWRDEPSDLTRLAEGWWLGLRLAEGLNPAQVRAAAHWNGPPDQDPALPVAREMIELGLLEIKTDLGEERFCLTPKGRPVADAIAVQFLRKVAGDCDPKSAPVGALE
ncbi:MAG: radical SAM family heme chaperone HemW [Planctomycetota bacterium]|nr:radical SAM family heme chaperone HemW [Planctomycetota bacterium]